MHLQTIGNVTQHYKNNNDDINILIFADFYIIAPYSRGIVAVPDAPDI